MARTLSRRLSRYDTSGITKSIPSISGSGKASPQSTTRILPAASISVMFLPTSPTPPSGMMRRVSVMSLLEEGHLLGLVLAGHQRRLHVGGGLLDRCHPFRLQRLASRKQRRRQPPDVGEQRVA